MPFKSKAQAAKFHFMEERGEIPKGTTHRWAEHTPGGVKSLPEHKKKKKHEKKAFVAAFFLKCAKAGITDPEQIALAAEKYAAEMTKQAFSLGDTLSSGAGTLASVPVIGAALGVGLPTMGGYLAGQVAGHAHNQADTDDADSLRISALANAYRRRAIEAKTNAQVQKLIESDPGKYVRIG